MSFGRTGDECAMAEQPPREPDPADEETAIAPPAEETVVRDDWGPESEVFVEQAEVVPRRRVPVIWPWLLALLVVVLGGLGAYYLFSRDDDEDAAATTTTVARSAVPVLVGLREARAEERIREEGFEPKVDRKASGKPKGVVFDQQPAAGAELERGKTVLIVVSNGPPKETVPDVLGQPVAEAVEDLQAAGLGSRQVEVFADQEAGTVVKQDPAGGGKLTKGATVELTVSKGPKPVTVPDVVGMPSSEATKTLRDAGFEANIVAVASTEPAGTVLAQNPQSGTEAAKGTSVRVNVAQPSGETAPAATTTAPAATTSPGTTTAPAQQEATVPDVVGQELADAARTFGDAGLKIAVQYVPNTEPQGRVVAQAQPAGTKRKRGDTVQVNVSTGPEPAADTQVPNVANQRQQAARQALERAGFEVLAIEQAGNPTRIGFVLSQTPSGGASIPRGSLVILYVGAR